MSFLPDMARLSVFSSRTITTPPWQWPMGAESADPMVMLAKEEANIRKNPEARATDLLKNVFGK